MTELSRRAVIKLTALAFGWFGAKDLLEPQAGQPPRELSQFDKRLDPDKLIKEVSSENYARVDGKVACMRCGEVISDWVDIEFQIHLYRGEIVVVAAHGCEFEFDRPVEVDGVYIDTPYFWYDLPIEGYAKTVNPGDTLRLEIGNGPV